MNNYVNPYVFLGMPEEKQQIVRERYTRPEIYKHFNIFVNDITVLRQYLKELPIERSHIATDLNTLHQLISTYLNTPSELSSDLMLKYPSLYVEGCGISTSELVRLLYATDRPRPLAVLRHVIWYVLREYQGYPLVCIAKEVKRDHATIISGIDKVKNSLFVYRGNCEMSKLLKYILSNKLPTADFHTSLIRVRDNHRLFVELLLQQREFYHRRIVASLFIYHLLKRKIQITDAEYRLIDHIPTSRDLGKNIDFIYLCTQMGIQL